MIAVLFLVLSSSVFAVDGVHEIEAIGLNVIDKIKDLIPFIGDETPEVMTVFQKGNQLFVNKQYEKANQMFKTDFSDIRNVFGAATTDRFLGRHDLAIQEYGKVLAQSPDFAEAYLGRGLSYRDSGQYEEAIGNFKKYISLAQGEAGYIALGDSYMAMGRYAEAQAILSQGVGKYPTSNVMKKMLSQAYLQTK